MDKQELAEERRVDEVEDTGARRAPGRVTVGEGKMDIYNESTEYHCQVVDAKGLNSGPLVLQFN